MTLRHQKTVWHLIYEDLRYDAFFMTSLAILMLQRKYWQVSPHTHTHTHTHTHSHTLSCKRNLLNTVSCACLCCLHINLSVHTVIKIKDTKRISFRIITKMWQLLSWFAQKFKFHSLQKLLRCVRSSAVLYFPLISLHFDATLYSIYKYTILLFYLTIKVTFQI